MADKHERRESIPSYVGSPKRGSTSFLIFAHLWKFLKSNDIKTFNLVIKGEKIVNDPPTNLEANLNSFAMHDVIMASNWLETPPFDFFTPYFVVYFKNEINLHFGEAGFYHKLFNLHDMMQNKIFFKLISDFNGRKNMEDPENAPLSKFLLAGLSSASAKYFGSMKHVSVSTHEICFYAKDKQGHVQRFNFSSNYRLVCNYKFAIKDSIEVLKINGSPSFDTTHLFGKNLTHINIQDMSLEKGHFALFKNMKQLQKMCLSSSPLKLVKAKNLPNCEKLVLHGIQFHLLTSTEFKSFNFPNSKYLEIEGCFTPPNHYIALKTMVFRQLGKILSSKASSNLEEFKVIFKAERSDWEIIKFFMDELNPKLFQEISPNVKGEIVFIIDVCPKHNEKVFEKFGKCDVPPNGHFIFKKEYSSVGSSLSIVTKFVLS